MIDTFWGRILFAVLVFVGSISFADGLPALVVDETHVFAPGEVEQLTSSLVRLGMEKNVWLVVDVVKSLGDSPIESYSVDKFNQYLIGDRYLDNGLLLVLVLDENKSRLEVGYGLEGSIPDIRAKYLLENVLKPFAINKQYFRGINAVISKLSEWPLEVQAPPEHPTKNSFLILLLILLSGSFYLSLFLWDFRRLKRLGKSGSEYFALDPEKASTLKTYVHRSICYKMLQNSICFGFIAFLLWNVQIGQLQTFVPGVLNAIISCAIVLGFSVLTLGFFQYFFGFFRLIYCQFCFYSLVQFLQEYGPHGGLISGYNFSGSTTTRGSSPGGSMAPGSTSSDIPKGGHSGGGGANSKW